MWRLFILTLVWLMGSAPAMAGALDWFNKGETLEYNVYWGPLTLGKAQLQFSSTDGGYQTQAVVKGHVPFFSLDDSWGTQGKISKNHLMPAEYHAMQAENDYRANKRLSFNHKKRTMQYQNLHDASEPVLTVPLQGLGQDPFSALYDLRKNGLPQTETTRQIMGLKRPFTLTISAPQRQQVNGRSLLLVTLRKTEPGRHDDVWRLWLTDDAELVPVQIESKLKFGSFRGILKGHTGVTKSNEESM